MDAFNEISGRQRDGAKPRICMPTARDFKRLVFQCGHYEAQDVLAEVDDVDFIHLAPGPGYQFKERWQRRLLYRDISKKLIFQNPGLRPVRLTRDYDLFIAICQTHHDFLNINAIEGWKDRCKTSICLIDEFWAALIPRYKYWLHALLRFDHVFIGYSGSTALLSKTIGKTCHFLPGAVDTLRFTPYPNPPERSIDVYSIGRRREGIHEALLDAAGRREMFYIHDTFPTAERNTYDFRQHRDLFANITKRSRYFMVAPGKMDALSETKGQVEIGYRYYEGAAAGAVMIGERPTCDSFNEMFPWPDPVIEIQPDGSDVMEILAHLGSEPERLAAMSRRNAEGALRRHDWVYRWKEMFRVAGFEPTPRMMERERRLKELADLAADPVEAKVHSKMGGLAWKS